MTTVIRTTWGDSIARNRNINEFKNKFDAESFVLEDEIKMTSLGFEFKGLDGVRNTCGWKDYCHYEIKE